MKIDTTIVLKDLEGNPLQHGDKDLTVGIAVSQVCQSAKDADPVLAWVLAQKFYTQPELDVRAEDIVFIKEQLKKSAYFPVVTGQVMQILDGESITPEIA